jgi:hypothetical protein
MAEMNYNGACVATESCTNVAHLAQAWPPTQLQLQARSLATNATIKIRIRQDQGCKEAAFWCIFRRDGGGGSGYLFVISSIIELGAVSLTPNSQ